MATDRLMTDKQGMLIDRLCSELGWSIQHAMFQALGQEVDGLYLTSRQASRMISTMIAQKESEQSDEENRKH